jgi:hypothetical protein
VVHDRDNLADERAPGLLEPDTLLASQYFDRVRRRAVFDGERRLMVAVLEDGVATYLKHAGAEEPQARELFQDAEAWVESDDAGWLYSFANVCAMLDLDAGYLRRGLRARKARATRGGGPEPARETVETGADERRRASGE